MKRIICALGLLLAVIAPAAAQDFPTRTLTMVVPFAAGGPTDLLGRIMAQRMGEILGQTVIVENVGGAGGMTGSKRVADAKPDGYTFVLGTVGTHAQGQTLYKHPLYNAATDFTPVGLIAEVPIVLIARKDLPANNLKDFVAYAKANQAKMQFGSAGAGSATHLGCVVLNSAMGRQHHAHSLQGHRPRDAGPDRRPHRLSVRDHLDGEAADRRRQRQADRDHDQDALGGRAEHADHGRAGPRRAGLYLERDLPAQGRAGSRGEEAQRAMVAAMKTPAVHDRLESSAPRSSPTTAPRPTISPSSCKSEIEKWAAPIKASGVTVE